MGLSTMSYLVHVTLVDLDSGEEEVLFEIEGSRCHFKKWFTHGQFNVQLRLDWDDIANSEPRLDADIWTTDNGKKNFLKKGEWHHTPIEFDKEGRKIYPFKFQDLYIRLGILKTMATGFGIDVILKK
jgi:hypothetical protein